MATDYTKKLVVLDHHLEFLGPMASGRRRRRQVAGYPELLEVERQLRIREGEEGGDATA